MKIRGFFGSFDAPYIRATLVCEKLDMEFEIKFLVDTGAYNTILSEFDASGIGLEYSTLEKSKDKVMGFGGEVETYTLPDVSLIFLSDEGQHVENISGMLVTKHEIKDEETKRKIECIPSVLGRNILNKYTMVVNKQNSQVVITDKNVVI